MKLRITVAGQAYDVQVEVLDDPPVAEPVAAAVAGPAGEVVAAPAAAFPWHGLSIGQQGETTAPFPGVVAKVLVQVGDAVDVNDPVVRLDVSDAYAAPPETMLGTVRAPAAGVVQEVLVRNGERVRIGAVLIRVK